MTGRIPKEFVLLSYAPEWLANKEFSSTSSTKSTRQLSFGLRAKFPSTQQAPYSGPA